MSPIDAELRAALRGRAHVVTPAPDPLAGIERRAQRIRRNRVAASVAGSALAVAAIAAVVPALQSLSAAPPQGPTVASAAPSAEPSTVAERSRYALDPDAPWAFRGRPVEEGTRATIEREYATLTRGTDVRLTPLFADVYEPSQQLEVVFVATVDGQARWGVAQSSEAGPEFLWDEALADGAESLAAALPGDEVARLLVVAAPEAEVLEYRPDEVSGHVPLTVVEPGIGTLALEGDPQTDAYRVSYDGRLVVADAPDPEAAQEPVDEPEATTVPQGYGWDPTRPWDFRGQAELSRAPDLAVQDERLFTARHGSGWTSRPLYAAESDAAVSLLFVLHTKPGEPELVSTTWQVGDRPVEYADQVVQAGQGVIQRSFPTTLEDGDRLLVALASPRAGGIVLTGAKGNRPDGVGDQGVGLWAVDAGEHATIRLSTEGDGVEYLVEPAATS